MQRLLIATGNDGKFNEIGDELADIGVRGVSISDENIELTRPEAGETYHENARIKADEGHDKTGLPTLADDSGLEVDALDGVPGVRSDRWAGSDASASDRNRKLLEELDGVPADDRTARFVCRMVLVDDGEEVFATKGVCEGRVAEQPRGDRGFGYDPVFEVKEKDWKTFGELAPRVKQWISHRARALSKMISLIEDNYSISARD